MSAPGRYVVDTRRFAHENVDGEVLVIDMDGGSFFSMTGTAAAVWALLAEGRAVDDVVGAFQTASGAEEAEIRAGVEPFVHELVGEGILQPDPAEPGDLGPVSAPSGTGFERPVVEKFTDMQDLLTLDPIHEVDDTGWPHRAPPA